MTETYTPTERAKLVCTEIRGLSNKVYEASGELNEIQKRIFDLTEVVGMVLSLQRKILEINQAGL